MNPFDPNQQLGSEPCDKVQEAFGAMVWLAIGCAIVGAACGIWSLV